VSWFLVTGHFNHHQLIQHWCLSFCSLDSEFLVSTSTDGSARIWKIDEGAPLVNLTRSSVCYDKFLLFLFTSWDGWNWLLFPTFFFVCLQDEKIECCRFSRDGMKPFLFCTVAKGALLIDLENYTYAELKAGWFWLDLCSSLEQVPKLLLLSGT